MDATEARARKTPFHGVMQEMGAEFTEFFGSLWPDHFGDVEAEYRAQREVVGVMDASPINKWEFRGRDAVVAAQRIHSNNVLDAAIGQVRYGAFCDSDGLVIDDGTVFKLAEDWLWVMTNKNTRAEHFKNLTGDLEVEIEDITGKLPHLFFQGPKSREVLATVTDADLRQLGYFRFLPDPVKVVGVPVWLSRTGVSGELGYELFCRPDDAPDLLRRLVKETGARPYGLTSIEAVRIEAGVIVTDTDYPEHAYTPFDLSMDRLVNLDRDFVGRDALARPDRGPSTYQMRTLRLDSDNLPEYGSTLIKDGQLAGTLTSPAVSPLAGPIALALVRREFSEPGTGLQVVTGDSTLGAVVHSSHPAYDPEKKRPRA